MKPIPNLALLLERRVWSLTTYHKERSSSEEFAPVNLTAPSTSNPSYDRVAMGSGEIRIEFQWHNSLFAFEQLTHLSSDKTILIGTVTYNNQSINWDETIINFNKETVKYKVRGSRYQYSLEIDNRQSLNGMRLESNYKWSLMHDDRINERRGGIGQA